VPVPAIPGALLTNNGLFRGHRYHTIYAAKGRVCFSISTGTPTAGPPPADMASLAQKQYSLLAAGLG